MSKLDCKYFGLLRLSKVRFHIHRINSRVFTIFQQILGPITPIILNWLINQNFPRRVLTKQTTNYLNSLLIYMYFG